MRFFTAATLAMLLPCAALQAAERTIKTRDGKTYAKAEITEVGPAAVKISHDGGISVVPMENLPREIQKEVGYKSPADRQAEAERMDAEKTVETTIESQRRDEALKAAQDRKLKAAFHAVSSATPAEASAFSSMTKDALIQKLGEPVRIDHTGIPGRGITTLFYDEKKPTLTAFVIRDGEAVISGGTYKGVPIRGR